ncbi:unnamed protein product [Eruca vesicaria subsp. sativa]|uniref:F-box domain-containing protein n=1 Tax=Eruca vesicaria subsp. sativa TaxID=29727 RepID=A0ABC8J3D3_ERUVS|nr:unnamed protein product [Eruca vesicaria subsp. sativa]
MDKSDTSRQVTKWESLDRDILGLIFSKLSLEDFTMHASRVCISWFIASHNRTLWITVDLAKAKLQEGLSLKNVFTRMFKFFDIRETRRSLMTVTKFSSSVPKNLFFDFSSYIEEEDLMFAAARMPNIERLALPRWCFQSKNSFQIAFSQWKNLKTLIIPDDYLTGRFEFQAVGENCSNLTNLKYLGYLENKIAKLIVGYLKNIKKLSLRCSFFSRPGLLLLITGLQKLEILNISHSKELDMIPDHREVVTMENIIQAVNEKRLKFICCWLDNCTVCKSRSRFDTFWSYGSKHWRNDEINEFQF